LSATTIDLMRHGEPVGGRKYRGQIDDPLSDKGWRQMRDAVGDHCPWSLIISSPSSRCRDFAQELAHRHKLPLELDDRLKEIGFGAWEGQTAAQLQEQDKDILLRFWSDPVNNTPPGAEKLTDFCDRVISAWEDIVAHNKGKHILLVVHAGVIRMVLRHILEMPLSNTFRIKIPSAGISRVSIEQSNNYFFSHLLFHGVSL